MSESGGEIVRVGVGVKRERERERKCVAVSDLLTKLESESLQACMRLAHKIFNSF